jgi:hypothetical protein
MSYNTEATDPWLKDKQLQDHLTTGIRKHSSQAFLVFFIQPPMGAPADIYKSVPVPLSRVTGSQFKKLKGNFFDFFLYLRYSTLIHLPPRRFNCIGMLGSNLLREHLFVITLTIVAALLHPPGENLCVKSVLSIGYIVVSNMF